MFRVKYICIYYLDTQGVLTYYVYAYMHIYIHIHTWTFDKYNFYILNPNSSFSTSGYCVSFLESVKMTSFRVFRTKDVNRDQRIPTQVNQTKSGWGRLPREVAQTRSLELHFQDSTAESPMQPGLIPELALLCLQGQTRDLLQVIPSTNSLTKPPHPTAFVNYFTESLKIIIVLRKTAVVLSSN